MSLELANVLSVIQHTRDVTPVFERLRRLGLGETPVHAVRVVYEGLADLDSRHIGGVDELVWWSREQLGHQVRSVPPPQGTAKTLPSVHARQRSCPVPASDGPGGIRGVASGGGRM